MRSRSRGVGSSLDQGPRSCPVALEAEVVGISGLMLKRCGIGKGGVEPGRCQPTWITVHPVLWVPDQGWQRVTPRAHTRAHAGSSWSRVWSGSRLELGQSRRRDGLRRWTGRWIVTDRTEGGSKAMEFILAAKEGLDQVDGPPAAVLVGNRNVDRFLDSREPSRSWDRRRFATCL